MYAYAPHDSAAKRFWSYAMRVGGSLADRPAMRAATAREVRRLRRINPHYAVCLLRWMAWVGNYPVRWRRENGRWSDVTYNEFNPVEV